MRQIFQHLRTAQRELVELPCPLPAAGEVLIQSRASLISQGTERMLVEFSEASLISKARQQPERVRMVLDKMRTDGLLPTLEAVFRKLDEPMPLGYCNAGVVIGLGVRVQDLQIGDRVASNGPHAEIVCVPRHLVAKIPDNVTFDCAAFTVLASVALEGVRVANPQLGERVLVFGLGLVGLLVCQFLRANGCDVLAVDLVEKRLELARTMGIGTVNMRDGGDPVAAALAWTGGTGVDAALICAAAPANNEIVHQAAAACRIRGRIIMVGKAGMELRHADFYKKGLSLQLSTSYGPGRYDDRYEQQGQDYPLPYVRWTENRNFQAVLRMMENGALDVEPYITHRYALDEAVASYSEILQDDQSLGVVLNYPEATAVRRAVRVAVHSHAVTGSADRIIGIIGAGGFAKGVLVPALVRADARIKYIASRGGASALQLARKFRIAEAISDYTLILQDPEVRAVFILTGHASHAALVCAALEAGKHVFVEKPLALDHAQLDAISRAVAARPERMLMVGFNRRFSPHSEKIAAAVRQRAEPLTMTMVINAGELPADNWMQDIALGGGRIIGEGCHFVDLMTHLTGGRTITHVSAMMVGPGPAVRTDKMSIQLQYDDGSLGTIHYLANGAKSYPKERLEVFSDGRVFLMENFRVTRAFGKGAFRRYSTFSQDKGHRAEVAQFLDRVTRGGLPLIPYAQLENVTRATFAAMESARTRQVIDLRSYPGTTA